MWHWAHDRHTPRENLSLPGKHLNSLLASRVHRHREKTLEKTQLREVFRASNKRHHLDKLGCSHGIASRCWLTSRYFATSRQDNPPSGTAMAILVTTTCGLLLAIPASSNLVVCADNHWRSSGL